MDDRVGSRDSSSETERVAVVAMFAFCGGILLVLVGRGWEALISGGFCMLVGCLFFSPQIGGPQKVASLRVNRYLYLVISTFKLSKMAFYMIKTIPSPNIKKIPWDSSRSDQQTSSCLWIITNPYGPRFGYTYRGIDNLNIFCMYLYKDTNTQIPPSIRPNMP